MVAQGVGACVVAPGGVGHGWDTTRYGDTINERGYASYWNAFLLIYFLCSHSVQYNFEVEAFIAHNIS